MHILSQTTQSELANVAESPELRGTGDWRDSIVLQCTERDKCLNRDRSKLPMV